MWPPAGDACSYGYLSLNPESQHDHYHHHHHHHPHSSNHQENIDCYQTFTCPSDLPIETSYNPGTMDLPQFHNLDIPMEQTLIYQQISSECEHFLNTKDCEKCNVRHDDGEHEAIPIDDLVDIVMKTVENIKKTEGVGAKEDIGLVSKKRQQNKKAAAKYRDKIKAKWKDLQNQKTKEEKRNQELKEKVKKLETEVEYLRKNFISKICPS